MASFHYTPWQIALVVHGRPALPVVIYRLPERCSIVAKSHFNCTAMTADKDGNIQVNSVFPVYELSNNLM